MYNKCVPKGYGVQWHKQAEPIRFVDTRYEADLEGVAWASVLLVAGMFQRVGKSALFVKGEKCCAVTRITKAVGGKDYSTVLCVCWRRNGNYGHLHAKDCGSSWG